MKYGCIARRLGHSFSREIHSRLSDYEYELLELTENELDSFMKAGEFDAINVTIPYKQAVIPYLYSVSETASSIGAVNTVVNRGGRLYGYNTDFGGMRSLIKRHKPDLSGAKVLICGSGGTSKTAAAVAKSLSADDVYILSRSPSGNSISYDEAWEKHRDADVIINTTPKGMFPEAEGSPIELKNFEKLSLVIDAVYNPLRTNLVLEALERGIAAEGGLYMLVAQAVSASELFLDKAYEEGTVDRIFGEIMAKKENIVLCGMPGCGKTTVGEIVASSLGRKFIDLDREIVLRSGREITEIFAADGEKGFRDIESEVIKSVSDESGAVIATGGGAVLREENVTRLKRNGRLYFLDRPLERLVPTPDRPLALSKKDIEERYRERYHIYKSVADVTLFAGDGAENIAKALIDLHGGV